MKFFPTIKQGDNKSCGITCVKIIAKYFGVNIDTKFSDPSSLSMHSIEDILSYAEYYGLNHYAFYSSYSWLIDKVSTPYIVHLNGNHFVVVYKISKLQVCISDPADGQLKVLTKAAFTKQWLYKKGAESWKKGIVVFLQKK